MKAGHPSQVAIACGAEAGSPSHELGWQSIAAAIESKRMRQPDEEVLAGWGYEGPKWMMQSALTP